MSGRSSSLTRPSHSTAANGPLVLAGAMVLTLILGSVHAFSVFLAPMEQAFSASRAQVSLTYSLALVCLTLAVLAGHRVFGLLKPPVFALLACALAAFGCLIASWSSTLGGVWIGYSVLFGAANGLGYGYALQISAQAMPERKALAMGLTTAAYALGAAVFPGLLSRALAGSGFAGALQMLAMILAIAGVVAASLLHFARARFEIAAPTAPSDAPGSAPGLLIHLWIAYGAGVSAGLMVIGHATGLATSAGASKPLVLWAPILVAIGNMMGGVLAGWLTDRVSTQTVLTGLPILSLAGLLALLMLPGAGTALAGLALIGFAYGAIIAVYPAVISYLFGTLNGIRAYGRVFTAWGTAGLILPWLAGYLFDISRSYTTVLTVAAVISAISAFGAFRLPEAGAEREKS
ncbi:MAG: MFS transporter [Pseudomonadota bacterium]